MPFEPVASAVIGKDNLERSASRAVEHFKAAHAEAFAEGESQHSRGETRRVPVNNPLLPPISEQLKQAQRLYRLARMPFIDNIRLQEIDLIFLERFLVAELIEQKRRN